MIEKCCAFIGLSEVKKNKVKYVKAEIQREVLFAIENGYTFFICGMNKGSDLYFADVVATLKERHYIKLEAAIPYRNRMNTLNKEWQRLISICDVVTIHSEEYMASCHMIKNRYMVQKGDCLISVFDGRENSKIAATIRYARAFQKDVRIIQI